MAWQERAGDPDVVEHLPEMLDDAGFEIEHFEAHQRTARGCDSMYAWVDTWWHTFAPKLVEGGFYDANDCDTLLRELELHRGDPRAFIHCPPVYEVIARQR